MPIPYWDDRGFTTAGFERLQQIAEAHDLSPAVIDEFLTK